MSGRLRSVLQFVLQLILYVPLMAVIGVFSTQPYHTVMQADEALLRLSFTHAAQRKEECRQRSAEELARLAPNMRAAQDCPRERAVIAVELEVDGQVVLRREAPPTGFQRDGAVSVYQRLTLPAGRHRIVARLRDRGADGFNHVAERNVDLAPGGALLIDFSASQGGFIFRG